MDQARAREILAAQVRESFGKLVELREISVARRASGRSWVGNLYCVTRAGELRVGRMEIDEEGRPIGSFGVDQLIEALRAAGDPQKALAEKPAEAPAFSLDFDDAPAGPPHGDEVDDLFGSLDQPDLRARLDWLLSSNRREDLLEARRLLPRLLARHDTRASVLFEMGDLEIRLGEGLLALNYLEAAAREFADAGEVEALSQVAARAEAVTDPGGAASREALGALLERARVRLQPIEKLGASHALSGLGEGEVAGLERVATLVSARAGQDVLVEGAPARHLFVVKSGHLSIRLEAPDGGSRRIRCCFPGDLMGESSVLKERATCTATVRAEADAVLWRFEGAVLRDLCQQAPAIRVRIEAASSLHKLDSFFSMNLASSLDARVRDGLLGCVTAIRRAAPGEALAAKGASPAAVFLVVEGGLEYRLPSGSARKHERDSFALLHDALHDLPLEGDLVSAGPSSVVCFDARRLRKLAADAPPEVVDALERLA